MTSAHPHAALIARLRMLRAKRGDKAWGEAATALALQQERIAELTTALEASNNANARLAHLADKYKWQVRDTCKRAETAEARVAELERLNGLLNRSWLAKVEQAVSAEAERDAAYERCAKICETKVQRDAGYDGRFGGYGNFMGDMTGTECAAAIRAAAIDAAIAQEGKT